MPGPTESQADSDDDGKAKDALEPNAADQVDRIWAKEIRDKDIAPDPEDPSDRYAGKVATSTNARTAQNLVGTNRRLYAHGGCSLVSLAGFKSTGGHQSRWAVSMPGGLYRHRDHGSSCAVTR